jgi:hypothetical protein
MYELFEVAGGYAGETSPAPLCGVERNRVAPGKGIQRFLTLEEKQR